MKPLSIFVLLLSIAAVCGGKEYEHVEVFRSLDGTLTIYRSNAPIFDGFTAQNALLPADASYFLRLPVIQDELEMTESQREAFSRLSSESKAKFDLLVTSRSAPDLIREAQSGIEANVNAAIATVLLEHQTKRFKEIELQLQLRTRGLKSLANAQIIESLGLSMAQVQELNLADRRTDEKLTLALEATLDRVHRKALLEILTPGQLEEYLERLGPPLTKPTSTSPRANGFKAYGRSSIGMFGINAMVIHRLDIGKAMKEELAMLLPIISKRERSVQSFRSREDGLRALDEAINETNSELKEVLGPFYKQLNQLRLRAGVRHSGLVALTRLSQDWLKLTPDQVSEIKKAHNRIQSSFRDAALRGLVDSQNETLEDILNPQQRRVFNEVFGTPFYPPPQKAAGK